jgi:hypothetical protein
VQCLQGTFGNVRRIWSGSRPEGMNLSGKPGMVQPMQMPPTFGYPPMPAIQPRLVPLQFTTGPPHPSFHFFSPPDPLPHQAQRVQVKPEIHRHRVFASKQRGYLSPWMTGDQKFGAEETRRRVPHPPVYATFRYTLFWRFSEH